MKACVMAVNRRLENPYLYAAVPLLSDQLRVPHLSNTYTQLPRDCQPRR